jgi:putative transposase
MKYDPEKHHRHSIRLQDYDYSQAGAYFITVCTHKKECILGKIAEGKFCINNFGQCVMESWYDLPTHYPNIQLDEFVIMPNHIHGIIILHDKPPVGAGLRPALVGKGSTALSKRAGLRPAPTDKNSKNIHGLQEIVRAFKSFSSRKINKIRRRTGQPVWQRNYYEHIIRNESDLYNARRYIINNPISWENDDYY